VAIETEKMKELSILLRDWKKQYLIPSKLKIYPPKNK